MLYQIVLVALLALAVRVSSICPTDLSFEFIYDPTGPTVEPDGEQLVQTPSEGKAGQTTFFSGGEGNIFVIEEETIPTYSVNGSFTMTEICTRLDNNNEFWHCEGVFDDLSFFGCDGHLSYEGYYIEELGSASAEFALTGGTDDLEGFKGVIIEQLKNVSFGGAVVQSFTRTVTSR